MKMEAAVFPVTVDFLKQETHIPGWRKGRGWGASCLGVWMPGPGLQLGSKEESI
jgi:hypothetical protein